MPRATAFQQPVTPIAEKLQSVLDSGGFDPKPPIRTAVSVSVSTFSPMTPTLSVSCLTLHSEEVGMSLQWRTGSTMSLQLKEPGFLSGSFGRSLWMCPWEVEDRSNGQA